MRLIDADRLKDCFDKNVAGGYNFFPIIDMQPTVDSWKPCVFEDEESYPESFKEVMFTDGENIYIGVCDANYDWSANNGEDSVQVWEVIAWKEKPTLYKKEALNGE